MGFFYEEGDHRLVKPVGAPKLQPPRQTIGTTKPRVKAADLAVLLAFKDLQHAWHLQENQSRLPPRAVQKFERQAWDRLMRYLTRACTHKP